MLSRLVLAATTLFTTLSGAALANEELRFQVELDGKQIGYHSFNVVRGDAGETVSITADFDVTFLAIPIYSYDHSAREVWKQGCLDEIVSHTDDNGTKFLVDGIAENGAFKLTTGQGQRQLDVRCVMTFAYWNQDFLSESKLLNAQTGEYVDVSVRSEGMEGLAVGEREVMAARYRVSNPAKSLDITVWYHESTGEWLSLQSAVGKGRTIRYQRVVSDTTVDESERLASIRNNR